MQKKLFGYICLSFFIFIIDRVTKIVALSWCAQSAYTLTSFLSCELHFNRGISWGLLHYDGGWIFLVVSIIIAIITIVVGWHAYYRYFHGQSIIGHVCIITGSLCNLIDRVVYNGVIDFIIVSYKNFSWPVFNVADAAIVVGVMIMFLQCEE